MEFSRETAVLQSAFSLANQLSPGGLQQFEKNESTKPLQILQEAAEEIIEGLEYDRPVCEQSAWQRRLVAIFTYLFQRHLGVSTESTDGHFEAVTSSLPNINANLYYQLVKNQKWSLYLFQTLDEMEEPVAKTFIFTLLDYVSVGTDAEDVELLMSLLQYLFIFYNPVILKYSTRLQKDTSTEREEDRLWSKVTDLCTKMGSLCNKAGLSSNGTLIKVLETLMLLSRIFHGKFHGTFHCLEESYLKSHSAENTCLTTTSTDVLRVGQHGDYLLVHSEEDTTVVMASPFEDADFQLDDSLLSSLWQCFLNMQSPLKDFVKKDSKDMDNVLNKLWESPKLLTRLCQLESQIIRDETERNFTLFFARVSAMSEQEAQCLQLAEFSCFLELLQPLNNLIKQRVVSCDEAAESIERKLEAASFLIGDNRSSSDWQDWILQIEDVEIWTDHRFLWCFKENLGEFCSPDNDFDLQAIRLLHRIVSTADDQYVAGEARKLSVSIFEEIPATRQVTVLEKALNVEKWTPALPVTDDFKQRMTLTLNRLVNSTEDEMENLVKQVATLALQHPVSLLERLTDTAIRSAAQTPLLAEILQELSPLARLEIEEGQSDHPVLCDQILELVSGSVLTRQEMENLKKFVRILLQPYRNKIQTYASKEDSPPVLRLPDFIKCCILPNLESPFSPAGGSVSMEMTLGLLLVAMDTAQSLETDWLMVTQCHMFPIMLCMCHVIEECRDLWNASEDINRAVLKELAVDCIQCFLSFLVKSQTGLNEEQKKEDEKAVRWLHKKLSQNSHWTTALYGLELVLNGNFHNLPVTLPIKLRQLLTFPDGWITVYKTVNEEGLTSLFELSRVSDHLCNVVISGLIPERAKTMCYQSLILSLSQVLLHCTSKEWQRIARVLLKIVQCKDIVFSGQRDIFSGMKFELLVPTLLLQSLQLILATSGEQSRQEKVVSQWLHLGKCYTSTLKNVCLAEISKTDPLDCLQYQAEVLSHLCVCLHILPDGSTEPVYVLTLDLLNSCTSLVHQLGQSTNHNDSLVVRQCVAHIGDAIELVDNATQRLNLDKIFQDIVLC